MKQAFTVLRIGRLLFLLLLLTSGSVQAQMERYLEGVHYTRIADTAFLKSMDQASGKANVLEVFWYGCGFCNTFDPLLNEWVEAHEDSIAFARSPMIWNATTEQHARAYFAAQQLGIYEQVHADIFAAIHQRQNNLLEEDAVAALFEQYGVSPGEFATAWRSFAVDAGLRKAETMQREMQVPSVPALVVDGRWLVNVNEAVTSQQAMLDVVQFLLDQDKAAAL